MSMINDQVKHLRNIANEEWTDWTEDIAKDRIRQAAGTIESLSAKLQAENTERNGNEILKEIREKAQKLSNQHWGDDERHLIGKGIQCMCVQAENIIKANMERSAEDCGGWIPCKKRLPEKGVMNPITNDYAEYLCTVCVDGYRTVRPIKFDRDGCWVNHGMNFDKYVTAWQPLPDPYHEP